MATTVLYAATNTPPQSKPLTKEEQDNLETLYSQLEKIVGRHRDYAELWKSLEPQIASFVGYAKAAFPSSTFGGEIASGSEFAVRPIRAVTIFPSGLNPPTTTTPQYSWSQNLSAGWNTLFNINLNFNGGATQATQLRDNAILAIFGLIDPAPNSSIEEADWTIMTNTYGILPLTMIQMTDFAYYDFGGMLLYNLNQTGKIRVYTPSAFTTRARAFGLEAVTTVISSSET